MAAELGAWRNILPDREREEFKRGEFGRRVQPGSRPALLVVDMTRMMFDPEFGLSPEGGASTTFKECVRLVDFGRSMGWPIFWTRRGPRGLAVERGGLDWKWEADGYDEAADSFVAPLAPERDESVIQKAKPSCFFETPLRSQLTYLGVDTLVLCGMSTSGCVRAAVLDAFSCNFRVLVAEDATGDRSEFAHNANLLDIDMKLGSVVTFEELSELFNA